MAALIHQKFPLDKAPPQPPFQTHFCGMYLEQVMKVSFFFPVVASFFQLHSVKRLT